MTLPVTSLLIVARSAATSTMGKLNIAHHKSYHPYRLDNIERVKRDEEEARRKEEGQEDRMRFAVGQYQPGISVRRLSGAYLYLGF